MNNDVVSVSKGCDVGSALFWRESFRTAGQLDLMSDGQAEDDRARSERSREFQFSYQVSICRRAPNFRSTKFGTWNSALLHSTWIIDVSYGIQYLTPKQVPWDASCLVFGGGGATVVFLQP